MKKNNKNTIMLYMSYGFGISLLSHIYTQSVFNDYSQEYVKSGNFDIVNFSRQMNLILLACVAAPFVLFAIDYLIKKIKTSLR